MKKFIGAFVLVSSLIPMMGWAQGSSGQSNAIPVTVCDVYGCTNANQTGANGVAQQLGLDPDEAAFVSTLYKFKTSKEYQTAINTLKGSLSSCRELPGMKQRLTQMNTNASVMAGIDHDPEGNSNYRYSINFPVMDRSSGPVAGWTMSVHGDNGALQADILKSIKSYVAQNRKLCRAAQAAYKVTQKTRVGQAKAPRIRTSENESRSGAGGV